MHGEESKNEKMPRKNGSSHFGAHWRMQENEVILEPAGSLLTYIASSWILRISLEEEDWALLVLPGVVGIVMSK